MSGETSDSSRCPNTNLVEQMLDQGQKLRNSMVKSILNNDPFCNTFSINVAPNSNLKKMHAINMDEENEKSSLTTAEKHKVLAYLKGDEMSPREERDMLETFRAMSTTDICELTERSYSATQHNCNCDTCRTYYKQGFIHEKHKQIVPPLDLKYAKSETKQKTNLSSEPEIFSKGHPLFYLKYVDSLKIAMHSFKLNREGIIKISSSFLESKSKLPQNLSTTYYIEYDLPTCIIKNVTKKSKVDSGLQSVNNVKLCSKKYHKEAVYFKQISIHDINNLHMYNLNDIEILFKVSCRNLRQNVANTLGYAKFNMASFKDTKYLTCNQELLVFLRKESPIVIGTVKVSLQLGCGKLYFGKDFLDSMSNNVDSNIILPEVVSYDSEESDDSFKVYKVDKSIKTNSSKVDITKNVAVKPATEKVELRPRQEIRKIVKNVKPPIAKVVNDKKVVSTSNIPDNIIEPKTILFGFIYIAEVEYLEVKQKTFFTFQPFCQEGLIYSPAICGASNPVFNFHQKIPLIYEEQFITKLRDNFMIFEFWEKINYQDKLIGTCSIPLHQYYLAFRNSIIVNYLTRNKLPVIGTDWYEPISDPKTGSINGQVQILVALGSQVQIANLENERGFKDSIVLRSKYTSHKFISNIDNKIKIPEKETVVVDRNIIESPKKDVTIKKRKTDLNTYLDNKKNIETANKSTNISLKLDKECQSETQLLNDTNLNSNKVEFPNIQTAEKASQSELKSEILPQISSVESLQVDVSTNTDPSINFMSKNCTNTMESENNHQPNMRKTTDLLDSLQSAFNFSPAPQADTFKAHIVVESALHLPSVKKSRFKKGRGKKVKEEIEILPSTYVYFCAYNTTKISQVVSKSTSPKWDFRSDVSLSSNVLLNNQPFIVKVWKKSNNSNKNPNIQTDTLLGYASLDLTVLLAGMPTVQGWFNLEQFTNTGETQCIGQIKISITPLENLNKYYVQKYNKYMSSSESSQFQTSSSISPIEKPEEPSETLNRTLKRKFTELDEITQRLRMRLSTVMDEESDTSNDGVADEFENDINTLCVEDDYNTVDFVREAQDLSMELVSNSLLKWQGKPDISKALMVFTCEDNDECASQVINENKNCNTQTFINDLLVINQNNSININLPSTTNNSKNVLKKKSEEDLSLSDSNSVITTCSNLGEPSEVSSAASLATLDKQLTAGKNRIDSLLQKLTLVSNQETDSLSSRYVSGCSVNQEEEKLLSRKDTEEDIMHELGIDDNFDANRFFDSTLLDEIKYGFKSTAGSSTKSTHRDAPDGAGYSSDM